MFNFNFLKLTRVGGWINLLNIKLFYDIANYYKKKVNILEIGTHHGRSLIPLIKGSNYINQVLIIDIFEKQKLNISKSGKGNIKIFLKNLKKFNIDSSLIQIINDTSINYNKYLKQINKIGYFDIIHIDGGHNKKAVKNDMKLARKFSNENTIFILDDIFNPSFPEVINAFLDENKNYKPIFISDQKIFFTKSIKTLKKIQKYLFKKKNYNKKKVLFFNKETFYIFEESKYFKNYLINKIENLKSLFESKYHF